MSTAVAARNAGLAEIAEILKRQHDAKHDVVVPASAITSVAGMLHVEGAGPDGPVGPAGVYRPTEICDEGIADKLGIPLPYLRRLRADRPDLYDANVNGWLQGGAWWDDPTAAGPAGEAGPDGRRFLFRSFLDVDSNVGVGRALLSDGYKVIDSLDVLLATLDGARDASVEVDVLRCDLTERKMSVRLWAPEVSVAAEQWLRFYRSPFDGSAGRDHPLVSAGIIITNSETGGGAFQIAPYIVVQVCKNGQTRMVDAIRKVHLGGRLDEGVVRWSDDTQQKNIELVKAQTRDAVSTFLNADYLSRVVADVESKSGVEVAEPSKTVEYVSKQLRFSPEVAEGILSHFIKGGDATAGGLMHAVTSYAQVVDDADLAFEMEAAAFQVLDLAAVPAG